MTRPSQGALDFARRHNLPEPRTREEAIEHDAGVIRHAVESIGGVEYEPLDEMNCYSVAYKEALSDILEYAERVFNKRMGR